MGRRHWLNMSLQLGLTGLLGCLGVTVFACKSLAQSTPSNIVPDDTLGAESSQVIPNYQGLPIEAITGGATRGINLFHSFQEFNINNGRGAYFFSPNADIQNILARVTGKNRSEILGTLGTFGRSQPHLYLINPNGIVFGENASLDVGGSFVATTANRVKLGETGFFSATEPASSNLLSINPSALLYNAIANQAEIVNRSTATSTVLGESVNGLQVLNGKSLFLVGGDVRLDGGILLAPGGRVELGGLVESGTVGLNTVGSIFSLSFPDGVTRGDVSLVNGADVFVRSGNGGSIAVNAYSFEIKGGTDVGLRAGIRDNLGDANSKAGNIDINAQGTVNLQDGGVVSNAVRPKAIGQAGDITIKTGSLAVRNGFSIISRTQGQGDAGNVIIEAQNVSLDGVDKNNFPSNIYSSVEQEGIGKSGDIRISTVSLSVTNGAQIQANTEGQGNAGNIIIDARDRVSLDGGDVFSGVFEQGIGQDGDIRISTGSLSLNNRSSLNTRSFGQGDAGNIIIDARDHVTIDNGYAFSNIMEKGRGNSGDIRITTQKLLVNYGLLSASTLGQGNAGNIIINASDNVSFKGSDVFTVVGQEAVGKGGDIFITTDSLSVSNGGKLSASTNREGDAGNIIINASDNVSFKGSDAFTVVEEGAVGKGGDIFITTGSLFVSNGGQLSANTNGEGDAGNIIINARDHVSFDDAIFFIWISPSSASSNVEWNGIGKGGDVRISTGSLSVTNDAQLSASTNGQGDAGNVIINARDRVSFDHGGEASSAVGFNGTGKGGDIRISTDSLFVTNDARLIASTNGQGDAGNVIINARDHVLFDNRGGALSRVDANKKGNGGEISITASSLSLTNWSQLTASTDGQGNAGNVIINAKNSVWLDNISTALSLVNEISTGNGGDILITTGSLSITNGAALSTRTRGQGDAGNIQIKATDSVSVSGTNLITGDTSALFTLTGNNYTGKGGNINIDTKALRVSDGALLDARTENNGKGGDITVNAGVVEVLNGGQIVSSSFGSGSAGKITINTTDQLIVNGSDATYFNRTAQFPEKTTTISPSSGFFVLSSGTGTTGEIFINSPKITLDNGGSFIAESASGNGGNINLNVSDLLLLRHNSQISTNAGTAQKGGDGGNINIDSRFIVAIPQENSDITANAFTGTGGNLQINSQGIFGIEPRPRLTNNSDITASSELGVAGVTNINSPDTSSIQNSLNELPQNVLDPNALLANSCIARRNNPQGGTFFITGSGGLPERPGDAPLSSFSTGTMQNVAKSGESNTSRSRWKIGDPIVEPTGVYRLANGQRVLSRQCS